MPRRQGNATGNKSLMGNPQRRRLCDRLYAECEAESGAGEAPRTLFLVPHRFAPHRDIGGVQESIRGAIPEAPYR